MLIATTTGSDTCDLLRYIVDPKEYSLPREFESAGLPKSYDLPGAWHGVGEEMQAEERQLHPDYEATFDGEVRRGPYSHPSLSSVKEGRAELIATNMAGRSAGELLEEFRALHSLRPDVQINTRHFILSTPEEDRVSRETQARIAERFASLMGLDRRMWAAFRHKDHAHDEIHGVTTNSDVRGALPSDSFIYDRAERAARQLEKEFHLSRNRGSRAAMRRCPKQGEFKQFERTEELSPVLKLQAKIDSLIDKKMSFTEFAERLEQNGISLSLIVGEKHVGAIYEFEGRRFRGRRLGRGYTFTGLQREWPDQQERKGIVEYVNERDYAAFSKRASRYAAARPTTTDSRGPRTDGSDDDDERGRRSPHSGEARPVGGLHERTTELAAGTAHVLPPDEQSARGALPDGTAPTGDAEPGRAGREVALGRGREDRPDGAPLAAGDDQRLQAGAGRDDQRVQEVPCAGERGSGESRSGDRDVSPAGGAVQPDDEALRETGRAVRGQLPAGGRDDKQGGSGRRRTGDGGGQRLDEGGGRGPAEVPDELPLFNADVSPTGVDDGGRVAEWHPARGGHSRVDFGPIDQQIPGPGLHRAREGQVSTHRDEVKGYRVSAQLAEDIRSTEQDAVIATESPQTAAGGDGIEKTNAAGLSLQLEPLSDPVPYGDEFRRMNPPDAEQPVRLEHGGGLTTVELPAPDDERDEKDTDDFGR